VLASNLSFYPGKNFVKNNGGINEKIIYQKISVKQKHHCQLAD
jgi:hypothetical protein